jgi:hypothetical protein
MLLQSGQLRSGVIPGKRPSIEIDPSSADHLNNGILMAGFPQVIDV